MNIKGLEIPSPLLQTYLIALKNRNLIVHYSILREVFL